MGERILGELGDRMVEAGLKAMFRPSSSGVFGGWTGGATDIGTTQPRSYWRSDMRAALEAAFEELLKEPADDR